MTKLIKLVSISIGVAFLIYFVFLSYEPYTKNANAGYCDSGLALALSIDRSQSMLELGPDGRTKLDWAKDATIELVDTLIDSGSTGVQITINSFGSQGNQGGAYPSPARNSTIDIGLTNNYQAVKTTISNIEYQTQGTCTECGVRLSNQITSSPLPKAAIFLSDGKGNRNWEGLEDFTETRTVNAANSGRSAGIDYWVVGYNGEQGHNEQLLRGVAGDPSKYFFEPNPSRWRDAYLQILNSICPPSTFVTPRPSPTPFIGASRISIPPVVLNGVGSAVDIIVSILSGNISFIRFDVDNDTIASADPTYDGAAAFGTRITAKKIGTSSYSAFGRDVNGSSVGALSTITVLNPKPWCQTVGGDVTALNNVNCEIPPSCMLPSCDPAISVAGLSGSSLGLVAAGGTIEDGAGRTYPPLSPFVSIADTYLFRPRTNYDLLHSKAMEFTNLGAITSQNILNVPTIANYRWILADCPATIPDTGLNLGSERVVLYAPCDLNVNGNVNITKGRGFFMAIVKGSIIVAADVKDANSFGSVPDNIPELNGIYLADGSFVSKTNGAGLDQQLHIRGSVVAGDFDLQRDFSDNSNIPSELFEFGPDQLLLIPPNLNIKRVVWREVAP